MTTSVAARRAAKHTAHIALALMIVGTLGACASSGPGTPGRATPERAMVEADGFGSIEIFTQPGVGERTIQVASADVWEILPGVYEKLQIPVTLSDPGRKELGNRGYRARRIEGARMSKYFRCGAGMRGALADEYNITLSVVTRLTDAPEGGTKILTTVDAIGRPRATSGNPFRCESTGVLELRVAQVVAEMSGEGS
ncbi:MAG: hypothetical protein BMS9Abin29_1526 [Gemmatimonadota bacterium]|nr:MAG: hypothetical protein BMS9Abin29_1526 [Gemmatimonadota bacterium]